MKIQDLMIQNFKAVKLVNMATLQNTVVIAGPNGCGKTCIFDAIRLLKSVYGGYDGSHEYHQWFQEHMIQAPNLFRDSMLLLRDKNSPMMISAKIVLTDSEINFMGTQAEGYIVDKILREKNKNLALIERINLMRNPEIRKQADQLRSHMSAFSGGVFPGSVTIQKSTKTSGQTEINYTPNPVLEMAFSLFNPPDLGVIDFHGAQRGIAREDVGQINLNIGVEGQHGQIMKKHALYGYTNKYRGIKQEMANSYIKGLIAEKAGQELASAHIANIQETLQKMFDIFMPGKEFKGPVPLPDGRLRFPVSLGDNMEHDLNELSSGEKEIMFSYLRIVNSGIRNSIILIDEPEMHLNPRMEAELPKFYSEHLGKALGNQIWLVTHSDALIRGIRGDSTISMYHMKDPTVSVDDENQAVRVEDNEEIHRTVLDMVGDLAAYTPNAKVVIFEGGGDIEFDLNMTRKLFPELAKGINLVSGGNKMGVLGLNRTA